ncbi:endonuclease III [Desulfovirgula thermocuniculi]|uniref:endonuclease III n=1 Tax=Desulfovirgula thermocuniculi TaxID=348842 RepID=UPI000485D31E|nr:endonuclease III [Desulfovirgula thermocuniculi]
MKEAGEARRVREILDILARTYPEARTALLFETPFQLLVAAILSAQTTDRQVNRITRQLFARYREPEDFARLTPEELAREIRGCGLYKNKSRHIIAASRILVEKYGSRVPESLEELQRLPGVGRKTANVVLNVAFGRPALPVDTHVLRVARRLGLARGKTPQKVEEELLAVIPEEERRDAHHRLIAHGRAVCKAVRPRCGTCSLSHLCPGRQN